MDSLHFVIAVGPLAMYLLLLGTVNLSPRPLVTTGGRDLAALAIGISGFVIAGPMELFMPEAFASAMTDALSSSAGPYIGHLVWGALLLAYALGVLVLVLLARPRIVIYNITAEQLRPALVEVVSRLDPDARWAGESAVLPNLGVQFLIEPFAPLKNVQLVAAGPQSHVEGWSQLENDLVAALRPARTGTNPYGFSLSTFGVLLTMMVSYWLVRDPNGIAQSLDNMLGTDSRTERPAEPPAVPPAVDPTEKSEDAP